MRARPIRMSDDEWEKCKALGGAEWVRSMIARGDPQKEAAKMARREARLTAEKRRYLYTHAKPDGTVFYVGLGTRTRSRFFYSRSPEHMRLLRDLGREVVVTLIELQPDIGPYWQEQQLIEKLRSEGHPLCNRVAGRKPANASCKAAGQTL